MTDGRKKFMERIGTDTLHFSCQQTMQRTAGPWHLSSAAGAMAPASVAVLDFPFGSRCDAARQCSGPQALGSPSGRAVTAGD